MIPSGDQYDRCFPEDLIRRQAEVDAMNRRDRVRPRPAFTDYGEVEQISRSITGQQRSEE